MNGSAVYKFVIYFVDLLTSLTARECCSPHALYIQNRLKRD